MVAEIDLEVAILARVLGNNHAELPLSLARYLLRLGFSPQDQKRMKELARRNQEDELSDEEKRELLAYAKAGSLISLLKSRARRRLASRGKGEASA